MGNIANQANAASFKPLKTFVRVWLDSEHTLQRMKLTAEILQEEKLTEGRAVTPKLKKLRDQMDVLNHNAEDFLHVLEFEKVDGQVWTRIAQTVPPRPDVKLDRQLGYNTFEAAIAAARVSGKEIQSKDPQDDASPRIPLDKDDWDVLLRDGSGYDIDNIVNTVLDLNVFQASNRIAAAVKS